MDLGPGSLLYILYYLLHFFFIDGRESEDLGMYIFSRKSFYHSNCFCLLYLKNVTQASLSNLFDIVEQLKLRIAILIST